MFKYILILSILLSTVASIEIETLTKERLDIIKLHHDYRHHFIFFHQPTLDALRDRLETWSEKDIKIHINDCKKNDLPECETPQQTPVLLLFNRILIRFNGDPAVPQQIIEWGQRRINSSPKYINTRDELDSFITEHPNSFCFCQPPNELQGSGLFYTISKTLPFLNYCIINNAITYTELGLKDNNVTQFLDSATNRREFEYQHRFQAWQWFVKANMFPSIERVAPIVSERFAQKEKSLDFYVFACDFSLRCDSAWEEIKHVQHQLNKEELGYQFRLAIQDQKESFTFNLYFHMVFDLTKLPALAHIGLKSQTENAGKLVRQIQYFERFDKQTLQSFIVRTQKGEVQPFYLSAPVPKNNGFYGKASQKFIQKLVASNVQSVIAASENHYVLLITALQIHCQACQNFYKEYKQIASLLSQKDVTFGVLNVNLNEVPFKQVTQLPDLFLFRKDNKQNPIRMNVNHSFDHLMLFFKNNLGSSYSDPHQL